MAEVILPPIETEPESPEEQLPEVEKPTELSKVITVKFNPLDTGMTSTANTRQAFYTTDTDAWIVFEIENMDAPSGEYSLVLYNKSDGSIFQRTGDIVSGAAYYKIEEEEIKHAGDWVGQVVITLVNGKTTTSRFSFNVAGHLLDGKDVRQIVIQDFETLMKQLEDLKNTADIDINVLKSNIEEAQRLAKESEVARQETFEVNESERIAAENERKQAELSREETYDSKVDAAIVEADVVTKVDDKVAELSPTIQNVTAQLAQTENEFEMKIATKTTKGDIGLADLNKNTTQFDDSWFTDSVKQQWVGDTPVNATPANKSITTMKMANRSVTSEILSKSTNESLFTNYKASDFEVGSITSAEGIDLNTTNRIRTKTSSYLLGSGAVNVLDTGVKFSIIKYTLKGVFINTTGWLTNSTEFESGYLYRVLVAYADDRTLIGSDIPILLSRVSVYSKKVFVPYFSYEQGGLSSSGGQEAGWFDRVRTGYHRAESTNTQLIMKDENKDFAVIFYNENRDFVRGTGWVGNPYYKFENVVTNAGQDFYLTYPLLYRVVVRNKDNSDITIPDKSPVELFINEENDKFLATQRALNFDSQSIITDELRDITPNNSAKIGSKGAFLFKYEIDMGIQYISSSCMVGDELWSFPVSTDDNISISTVQCHKLDFDNREAPLVATFEHNWGHVNSVSYSEFSDSIILGNGSGSYSLYAKILIFENASDFKNRDRVDVSEATIIDVSEFGIKANVVWGESNNGKGNVCYVITNDNKNIRKLLLGQGSNQFENGNFASGKSETQFNGTYKTLAEYSQENGDDVIQGSHYVGGRLYLGLGHSILWYSVNTLHDDGSITKEMVKETFYKADGSVDPKTMQGITVTGRHVIVGLQYGTLNEIYVYER